MTHLPKEWGAQCTSPHAHTYRRRDFKSDGTGSLPFLPFLEKEWCSEAASISERLSLPWGPPVGSGDVILLAMPPIQAKIHPRPRGKHRIQNSTILGGTPGDNPAGKGAALYGALETKSQSALINLPILSQVCALYRSRKITQGHGSGC